MKVLAIVQARMGSTRLPGKVLMKICGKSILELILESLKFSKLLDQTVVATTDLSEDTEIEQLCKRLEILCYRGSANDVLERYYKCAQLYDGDLIVRITADDPLIDANIVNRVIQTCIDTKCDLASTSITKKYPLGYFIEALTFPILEKLYLTQKDQSSREHVTLYIKQNQKLFNIQGISPPNDLARPQYRLTIDYMEDFILMSALFERLYKSSFIPYEAVIKFLDENPELIEINRKIG